MSEPFSIGAGAATLISATASIVTYYLRSRTRERLAAIKGAAEKDRARMAADALAMFDIPVEKLTRDQSYSLAIHQLEDRNKQRNRQFFLFLILMIILAATTISLSLGSPNIIQDSKGNNSPNTVILKTNHWTNLFHIWNSN